MRPLVSGPVLVRIIRWDEQRAWTDDIEHARRLLISSFRASGCASNLETKRLIKAIIAKQATEIFLPNGTYYSSIRHCLQSIGAEVEVVLNVASMSGERGPV